MAELHLSSETHSHTELVMRQRQKHGAEHEQREANTYGWDGACPASNENCLEWWSCHHRWPPDSRRRAMWKNWVYKADSPLPERKKKQVITQYGEEDFWLRPLYNIIALNKYSHSFISDYSSVDRLEKYIQKQFIKTTILLLYALRDISHLSVEFDYFKFLAHKPVPLWLLHCLSSSIAVLNTSLWYHSCHITSLAVILWFWNGCCLYLLIVVVEHWRVATDTKRISERTLN